jgi:hypothetical protein
VFGPLFAGGCGRLQDDLPLLCCDLIETEELAVCCGGGLAPELLVGVVKKAREEEKRDDAGETLKKLKKRSETAEIFSVSIPLVSRGAVTAVLLRADAEPLLQRPWALSVYLGCQNGSVVRMSLLVAGEKVQVVGNEEVLHSHRMDVRGLAIRGPWLSSVSDDGTVRFASLVGKSNLEPILISRELELLSCCFVRDNVVWIGTRDHTVLELEYPLVGESNKKKKKEEAVWKTWQVPRLARWIGCWMNRPVVSWGGAECLGLDEQGQWQQLSLNQAELQQTFKSMNLELLQ